MIAVLLALLAVASAADLSLGVDVTYNDPLLVQSGLRAAASQGLSPGVSLGLLGGFNPDLGELEWRRLTHTLVEDEQVSPDVTRVNWDASLAVQLEPFRGRIGPVTTALGLYAGPGLIRTQDDLEALGTDVPDQEFASTQRQTHLALTWGTYSDVLLSEVVRLRLRWHHLGWAETLGGVIPVNKHAAQVGLEVGFALGVRGGMGKPTMAPAGFPVLSGGRR